ncbi:hypothetical protein ACKWTF_002674 [Chironomus riparius]
MYSSVCDDDILEINADINDILSEDETACIEVINSEVIPLDKASQDDLKLAPKEFVWLKFFRKGNLSCSNLRMEILSGEVLNVVSAGFIVDNRFSVHETFLLIHEELKHNMNFFIGMRLVTCTENSEESCIRFSVRHPYLNTEVLSKLKKIFSVVHFSFTTMHLLPVHKAEYIESVCYSLRINDDLKIITNDDAIYPKKPIQN